jgi:Spy/CpxP family protein refolding chaperone
METHDEMTTPVPQTPTPTPTTTRGPRRRGLGWMLLAVPLLLGTSFSLARAGGPDQGPDGGPGMWMGGGGEHGGPGGPRQRMERVLTAVGASDAQKAQVKTIWEGLRPQLKALHQEHEQVRKQIAEALAAPTIDAAHIEQLRKQSVQTMDKLSALMTSGLVQSAGVLTPDQRKQALETMKEHEGRHGGFRGHGPGAGPGPGAAQPR